MTIHQTAHRQPTSMTGPALRRAIAASSIVGGALLGIGVVLHALEPAGCIGALECATRSMRSPSPLTAALIATALPLLTIALAGITVIARRAGRPGRLGSTGAMCLVTGVGGLVGAVVLQEVVGGGDFSWMPWLVLPSMLAVVVGIVLIAASTIRTDTLPRWLGGLIAASGVALLAVNDQSTQVLLALPLAATAVVLGSWVGRAAR